MMKYTYNRYINEIEFLIFHFPSYRNVKKSIYLYTEESIEQSH